MTLLSLLSLHWPAPARPSLRWRPVTLGQACKDRVSVYWDELNSQWEQRERLPEADEIPWTKIPIHFP